MNPMLSRNDLNDSLHALHQLLTTADSYRRALITLSTTTAAFAKALEDCARLKGTQQPTSMLPYDPAQRLLAASGLHFISANLLQLLSVTIQNSFESPLDNLYESYRHQLNHQQTNYQTLIALKTRAIRETELRNLTQPPHSRRSRHSPRDLDTFRRGLKELQEQVDQVETLKESYYHQLAIGEREIWSQVAENVSLVVKSEVEVFDRIASKPTSDATLEWMTTMNPDPFDAYKPLSTMHSAESEAPEIYSILDPLSHLIQSRSPSRVRKSLDLSQSVGSVDHLRSGSTKSSSSDGELHSIPTNLWASHSVAPPEEGNKTPPPQPSIDAHQSSPAKNSLEEQSPTNVTSLPSTKSSLTITPPPSSSTVAPAKDTPMHTATHPNLPTSILNSSDTHAGFSRKITDSSLQGFYQDSHHPVRFDEASCYLLASALPVPRQPVPNTSLDDLDNLLREQPPNGIDLSDSDL